MAQLRFTPEARNAYEQLDTAGETRLLDAVDAALDLLEANPGDTNARQRAFGDGLWGITVRGHSDNWLIVWEHDTSDSAVIRIRYIGPDPFG